MKKLDYEVRELAFKEELTKEEELKLFEKMRKNGFDLEQRKDNTTYVFIKFN